jgi:hypothetical protein
MVKKCSTHRDLRKAAPHTRAAALHQCRARHAGAYPLAARCRPEGAVEKQGVGLMHSATQASNASLTLHPNPYPTHFNKQVRAKVVGAHSIDVRYAGIVIGSDVNELRHSRCICRPPRELQHVVCSAVDYTRAKWVVVEDPRASRCSSPFAVMDQLTTMRHARPTATAGSSHQSDANRDTTMTATRVAMFTAMSLRESWERSSFSMSTADERNEWRVW